MVLLFCGIAHAGDIDFSRVAHAGGGYQGIGYSNSLEALNENYRRGFRVFEIDFLWTKDARIVAVHDWEDVYRQLFPEANPGRPSFEYFMGQRMIRDWTQLSLQDVIDWFQSHKDAYLVTDAKERNRETLKRLNEASQLLKGRIIPQIYSFDEYDAVRQMGYTDIILTLYRLNAGNDLIEAFVQDHPVAAVTMWSRRPGRDDLARRLIENDIPILIHTVNSIDEWRSLEVSGITGIYTDTIIPVQKDDTFRHSKRREAV